MNVAVLLWQSSRELRGIQVSLYKCWDVMLQLCHLNDCISSCFLVDINLSAKTAHPSLSVSEDRKQVRHTDKLQEVPDNPKRFDRVANILAKEHFSNGRYYWEVEVGEKIEWNLGVVRQSINRKGKFTVCPANGFWTLSLKTSGQYMANSSPVTHVALEQRPKRVGVFLDYTEGCVSFYCADSGVHIHTFTDNFTDRLHPFFSPGRLHGGKNAAPLIDHLFEFL